jgi:hypothetical protein
MARRPNICPPGILCITPSLILLIAVILIGIVAFIYISYNEKKIIVQRPLHHSPHFPSQVPISINVERGGDDRYTRAPKPLRNWVTPVDLEGALPSLVPFNSGTVPVVTSIPVVPTRGLPEAYQSMGIVTTSSGELLPLYGRRLASRSDRFNYYTRTDTNNPIPLPIRHKKRDCQDDIGCEELFDGDSVEIAPTKQNGSVTIYRFNGPTYIPGLI